MGPTRRSQAYDVRFASRRVVRELADVDAATAQQVAQALRGLQAQPRPPGSCKLRDTKDLRRLRVGAYRLIYQVDDTACTVVLTRIARRDEKTYRRAGTPRVGR
jgi:mRNA interferase RelE/StbE